MEIRSATIDSDSRLLSGICFSLEVLSRHQEISLELTLPDVARNAIFLSQSAPSFENLEEGKFGAAFYGVVTNFELQGRWSRL